MLFHTWPFALFFLVVYPVYLVLKGTRFRLPWLLAASYFFYACFNPLYLILIGYATLLDYTVVTRMAKSPRRKMWLSVSIINNIGLLGFFKYAGFVRRLRYREPERSFVVIEYLVCCPRTRLSPAYRHIVLCLSVDELYH